MVRAATSRSRGRVAFLKALARDLRQVGIPSRAIARRDNLVFAARIPASAPKIVASITAAARARSLRQHLKFSRSMEQAGVLTRFADGCDLDPRQITPELQICRTTEEFALFRYCQLLQAVGPARLTGRQIRAIVIDRGHPIRPIIGVIGLSSSIFTVRVRDEYLGWSARRLQVKQRGLRHILDLRVCLAVPPYSYFHSGKLLASLAVSDSVQTEFARKYGENLLAVVTTCATGPHCPIFHRIMIKKGGLFRKVGETAGYSTDLFHPDTIHLAKRLASRTMPQGRYTKLIRVLRIALRECGIEPESILQLGVRKGVYIATVSDDSLSVLREGGPGLGSVGLRVEDCIRFWRNRLLVKRLDDSSIIARARAFTADSLSLFKRLA